MFSMPDGHVADTRGRTAARIRKEVVCLALAPTNCSTITLSPEQGGAAESGLCGPVPAAATTITVPRLVRARTLLDAADIERLERSAAGGGSTSVSSGASPLLVFARGDEKHVASLDGLVPSDAVVERLADGQVNTLAKVVGG